MIVRRFFASLKMTLSSASFTAITRVARHAGDSYSQFLLSFIILVELNHSLNALAEYIKVKILIG